MPALLCAAACFVFLNNRAAAGQPHALIVTGLAGSPENAEEFHHLASETQRLLVARGFAADNVVVMADKPTRETILVKLDALKKLQPDDEFWLVLYGAAGMTQGDMPAFQVSGPRLTADDLKKALDAIPAKQFVFIGTNESGLFLPALQNPRRAVVAATKGEGEPDQPRYPDEWIAAFGEKPTASFTWIAARASELVEKEYEDSGIVQTEHARLADPVTGKILEPPFGVDTTAPAETPSLPTPTGPLPTASDIQVKINDPKAVWEHQPATDETKKLIADAKAAANPGGYPAIILEQRIGYTVEQDRTADKSVFYRVYIESEDGVSNWADAELPQLPPEVTSKLDVARVIQPDGSSIVFNPAKLGAPSDMGRAGEGETSATVFLPEVHAGCIVEIGFQVRELPSAALPEVSDAVDIQREVPALVTRIEVRVPEKKPFRVVLKNNSTPATETTENERHVYRWNLGPLAAAEPLTGDPPARVWTAWLGISSLQSWDDFAAWFRRISAGSDAVDESVRKTAADLATGAKTRREKIERVFDFVSALRYEAVEIGIQGFRPRTPEQVLANRYGDCKDKANLIAAMLKSLGIDAQFALVNRGGSTDVDFPSWQFNHAVCFVPKSGDDGDLWLDSTEGFTPFGSVPPGDMGRNALVFEKEKAEFKKIAQGDGGMSMLDDEWDLRQADAGWTGTFSRKATGLAEYEMRSIFTGLSPLQRQEKIHETLSRLWPQADFGKASVSSTGDLQKPVAMDAAFTLPAGGATPTLPLPAFAWLGLFDMPDRDRPL
ncbi:MAG TPA: DUF3857 domain-containing protein, partial [Chthoniobacteraceae bacterium]|nr:DUF3857 domain-containing protein [Chthoniobacteraceae bacterium]